MTDKIEKLIQQNGFLDDVVKLTKEYDEFKTKYSKEPHQIFCDILKYLIDQKSSSSNSKKSISTQVNEKKNSQQEKDRNQNDTPLEKRNRVILSERDHLSKPNGNTNKTKNSNSDEEQAESSTQTLERFFGEEWQQKYSFSEKMVNNMKKMIRHYNKLQKSNSSAGVRAGQSRQLRVELESISREEVPKKQLEKDETKKEISNTKMVSKDKLTAKNKKQHNKIICLESGQSQSDESIVCDENVSNKTPFAVSNTKSEVTFTTSEEKGKEVNLNQLYEYKKDEKEMDSSHNNNVSSESDDESKSTPKKTNLVEDSMNDDTKAQDDTLIDKQQFSSIDWKSDDDLHHVSQCLENNNKHMYTFEKVIDGTNYKKIFSTYHRDQIPIVKIKTVQQGYSLLIQKSKKDLISLTSIELNKIIQNIIQTNKLHGYTDLENLKDLKITDADFTQVKKLTPKISKSKVNNNVSIQPNNTKSTRSKKEKITNHVNQNKQSEYTEDTNELKEKILVRKELPKNNTRIQLLDKKQILGINVNDAKCRYIQLINDSNTKQKFYKAQLSKNLKENTKDKFINKIFYVKSEQERISSFIKCLKQGQNQLVENNKTNMDQASFTDAMNKLMIKYNVTNE